MHRILGCAMHAYSFNFIYTVANLAIVSFVLQYVQKVGIPQLLQAIGFKIKVSQVHNYATIA